MSLPSSANLGRRAFLEVAAGAAALAAASTGSSDYALGRRTPPYDDMLPLIKELLSAYGPQRLMWGSDSPYQVVSPHTYRASIAVVRDRLDGLSEGDREWLLRKTAERVFFS